MVSNAKHYNERTSELHSDAEKIRKMVSTLMQKINPAYKDPNYAAYPTPLPEVGAGGEAKANVGNMGEAISGQRDDGSKDEDQDQGQEQYEAQSEEPTTDRPRRRMILHPPSAAKEHLRRRASSTPAAKDDVQPGDSLEGKTFQQAQEIIIAELIEHQDEK